MNSSSAIGDVATSGGRIRPGHIVLALVVVLPLWGALGIASFFWLSSPTQALRSSVMGAVPGQWHTRVAVHAGGITMGLVRWGVGFFNLPPEPKAALGALHGAELGLYKLQDAAPALDCSAVLNAADRSMSRRGWERIVGFAQTGKLVAVYMPCKLRSPKRVACCVVVINEQDLVVVSGRGNLEPLLELATKRLQETQGTRLLPFKPVPAT